MKTPVLVLALSAMALGACGESRLNPLNWFERAPKGEAVAALPAPDAYDPDTLVAQVIDLQIDPTAGGAIIRATGLPPTQGYWGAALVPANGGLPQDGVLIYLFRIQRLPGLERAGNRQSREVIAATGISGIALRDIAAVRVIAATNTLISRR